MMQEPNKDLSTRWSVLLYDNWWRWMRCWPGWVANPREWHSRFGTATAIRTSADEWQAQHVVARYRDRENAASRPARDAGYRGFVDRSRRVDTGRRADETRHRLGRRIWSW